MQENYSKNEFRTNFNKIMRFNIKPMLSKIEKIRKNFIALITFIEILIIILALKFIDYIAVNLDYSWADTNESKILFLVLVSGFTILSFNMSISRYKKIIKDKIADKIIAAFGISGEIKRMKSKTLVLPYQKLIKNKIFSFLIPNNTNGEMINNNDDTFIGKYDEIPYSISEFFSSKYSFNGIFFCIRTAKKFESTSIIKRNSFAEYSEIYAEKNYNVETGTFLQNINTPILFSLFKILEQIAQRFETKDIECAFFEKDIVLAIKTKRFKDFFEPSNLFISAYNIKTYQDFFNQLDILLKLIEFLKNQDELREFFPKVAVKHINY